MEKLLNQIDMREHHTAAAVPLQPESIQRVSMHSKHQLVLLARGGGGGGRREADPSVCPFSRRARYCVQRSPTTFPLCERVSGEGEGRERSGPGEAADGDDHLEGAGGLEGGTRARGTKVNFCLGFGRAKGSLGQAGLDRVVEWVSGAE